MYGLSRMLVFGSVLSVMIGSTSTFAAPSCLLIPHDPADTNTSLGSKGAVGDRSLFQIYWRLHPNENLSTTRLSYTVKLNIDADKHAIKKAHELKDGRRYSMKPYLYRDDSLKPTLTDVLGTFERYLNFSHDTFTALGARYVGSFNHRISGDVASHSAPKDFVEKLISVNSQVLRDHGCHFYVDVWNFPAVCDLKTGKHVRIKKGAQDFVFHFGRLRSDFCRTTEKLGFGNTFTSRVRDEGR